MYIDLTFDVAKATALNAELLAQYERQFTSGHFGTHIDIHLKSEIPLEYMQSRGILFDVSSVANRDIELSDFAYESVQAGDCVIFKTDMIKKHAYGTKPYFLEHSQLSDTVIDALITRGVNIIAIDAAGVRRGAEHVLADKRCEAQGIYIIENLDNLDSLQKSTQGDFKTTILWFKQLGKTGLPCRVVAQV